MMTMNGKMSGAAAADVSAGFLGSAVSVRNCFGRRRPSMHHCQMS